MLLSVVPFLLNNKPQLWVVTTESDQFFTIILTSFCGFFPYQMGTMLHISKLRILNKKKYVLCVLESHIILPAVNILNETNLFFFQSHSGPRHLVYENWNAFAVLRLSPSRF